MFGLFNKKKYSFECPMCGANYKTKFDPTPFTKFDYEFDDETSIITKETCSFCKTEMTVGLQKAGEMKAYDDKWMKEEKGYYDKLDPIEDEISEIEDQLDDDPNNDKLKKKLAQLESKKEKIETALEKKEERYSDRQDRWQEKLQDKIGNI